MENPLKELTKTACFSVTGSDPVVLKACMKYAQKENSYFICEATVNQVNQFGGYTGMKPKDYVSMVCRFADEIGFPREKLILSGDHLGPFVWRNLPEQEAMARSEELVRQYVAAGFRKIHLDPTMPLLGEDPRQFGDRQIAERAARLAKISEETYEQTKNDTIWNYRPVYVIGSEVPVPGGTEELESMQVTTPEALNQTLSCFQNAFLDHGLPQVWEDTLAIVAQIGLEFSEDHVYDFKDEAARPLANLLKTRPPFVFESHSSDYQTPECLQQMVNDGVGILKVGPELTFAHREALFSLSIIERELAPAWGLVPSHFMEVLEQSMVQNPADWEHYYHGNEGELKLKHRYSYSDRARYYFARPEVLKAKRQLLENLGKKPIPLYLISQYLPVQYEKIREGKLEASPEVMIEDKIQSVMERYYQNMKIAVQNRDKGV